MRNRLDKRWHRRRSTWVTPPEVFSPARHSADVIAERQARPFVEEHHYSGSYPAARIAIGLFGPGAALVGVAVFSVPMNQRVVPAYTGLDACDGAELGRFVCAPSVRFNGESWFLARAFPLVRAEKEIAAVVSYADPLERPEIEKPQHWGTIYQASNALFVGRAEARTHLVAPGGVIVSPRALSKIRLQTKGREYAARQLLELGAPARQVGEEPAAWVERVQKAPGFRRVRHPGNLTYVFGLTRNAQRSIGARHGVGLPYPRREEVAA